MNKVAKGLFISTIGFLSILGLKTDSANFLEEICYKNYPHQKEIILRAKNEIKTEGITSEQKEGYGMFSERVYNSIVPVAYCSNKFGSFANLIGNYYLKDGSVEVAVIPAAVGDRLGDFLFNERKYFAGPSREDAFRLYLGLPQQNNTLYISDYRPSKEEGNVPYYYKLSKEHEIEIINKCFEYIKTDSIKNFNLTAARDTEDSVYDDVMGEFKVSVGKDEKGVYVSYYDKWDLNPTLYGKEIKVENIVGKPFEIYNRIYFDPKSRELLN